MRIGLTASCSLLVASSLVLAVESAAEEARFTESAPAPESTDEADAAPPAEVPLVVPEQPTDIGPLLVPPGPARWVIRLRLQEGWDGNPAFEQGAGTVAAAEGGDSVTQGSLDIARRFSRPRSETTVSIGANGTLFARNSAFNQGGAGASAAWAWRPALRVGTRLGGDYSYGTRKQTVQTDEGLLLPHIRSEIVDGAAGLELDLGRHTKGALDVAYRRVTFDSPTMNDGHQLTASAQVAHRTTAGTTLTGDYAFTRGSSRAADRPARASHLVSLGWSGPLSPQLRVEASLGVIYLPAWASAESSFMPAGGASLVLHWKAARLEGGYRREAGEAFGYGFFRVADIFRLAWQQSLGRRLTWLNGATYGVSHSPGDTFELETVALSTTLSVVLGQRWSLAAGYSFRRRDYRSGAAWPAASSHTLSASLLKEWQAR